MVSWPGQSLAEESAKN